MERRKFLKAGLTAGLSVPFINSSNLWASENAEYEKLVILHTNDTHSRIDPFESGEYKGMGGISNRKTVIDIVRKTEKNVLLLDAGDIFQGTPYFNLYLGELEIKAMSMLEYDAATMGNHDFDAGLDSFKKQLKFASFPFIVSNYDFKDSELKNKILPYKIIKKGSLKIGIIGLGIELNGLVSKDLYNDTLYIDPIETASKYAAILKNDEKCDLVIALSHLGYTYRDPKKVSDIVLAESIENVDIILGGHTHTFLKCPKIIEKKSKNFVIINQVGWGGINLGKLDIYFNKVTKKMEKNTHNLLKCQ